MSLSLIEVFLRLFVSLILSGMVGLERESHGRPAGFRTHILVALGSTLVMIVSAYGFREAFGPNTDFDPARMAAQVISGIGFLGAGTIIHEGATIRGLTTAASLWSVAGIGLAVGIGMYYPAIITTGFVVLTLIVLNRLEFGLMGESGRILKIQTVDIPGQLAKIFQVLANYEVSVSNVSLVNDELGNTEVVLKVSNLSKKHYTKLLEELLNESGISSANLY